MVEDLDYLIELFFFFQRWMSGGAVIKEQNVRMVFNHLKDKLA